MNEEGKDQADAGHVIENDSFDIAVEPKELLAKGNVAKELAKNSLASQQSPPPFNSVSPKQDTYVNLSENQLNSQTGQVQPGQRAVDSVLSLDTSRQENALKMKSKTSLGKNSSIHPGYGYINDEENDLLEANNDPYYFNEWDVGFSYRQYLTVFFYHIVYFVLLGPLIRLFGICSKKFRVFSHNMAFGCSPVWVGGFQMWYWMTNVVTYTAFSMNYNKWSTGISAIDAPLLKAVIMSAVIRSTNIAGKYGTFSRALYKQYHKEKMDQTNRQHEYSLLDWRSQDKIIKLQQIKHSIKRLDVDCGLFYIAFLGKVGHKAAKRLEAINAERFEVSQAHSLVRKVEAKELFYYKGEVLLQFMIDTYNSKSIETYIWFGVGFSSSLTWAFSHLIVRKIFGQSLFGKSPFEYVIQINDLVECSLLFLLQFTFYRLAIADTNRKHFIMTELSYMISLKKSYKEAKKWLPTIDITDRPSLLGWLNLRRLGLDYGRKYFFRHEIFLPVSLTFMAVMIIISAGLEYYLKTYGLTESLITEIRKMQVSFMFDAFLYMLSAFHIIHSAGRLNDEFKGHSACMERNQDIIRELKSFKEAYFAKYLFPNSAETGHGVLGQPPSSWIHKKIASEIIKTLPLVDEADRLAELDNKLDDICSSYEILLEGMQWDKEYSYVTVLGFEVNGSSAVNGFISLFSAVFFLYELIRAGS